MSAWKCSLIALAKKHERRGNWVGRARTEVFQRVRLHFENILSTTTYDEISGSKSREKFEFESFHSALNAEERFPQRSGEIKFDSNTANFFLNGKQLSSFVSSSDCIKIMIVEYLNLWSTARLALVFLGGCNPRNFRDPRSQAFHGTLGNKYLCFTLEQKCHDSQECVEHWNDPGDRSAYTLLPKTWTNLRSQ